IPSPPATRRWANTRARSSCRPRQWLCSPRQRSRAMPNARTALPRGWRCIGETGTTSNDIARRRISNRAALAEGLSPPGSRRSATYPAPVFGQQSEDLRIGRLAVDEEALAQQAFAAEAKRLQQSTRGR